MYREPRTFWCKVCGRHYIHRCPSCDPGPLSRLPSRERKSLQAFSPKQHGLIGK